MTTDCYAFGPFQLYPSERRLLQDGVGEIPLGMRSFDLLVTLVARHAHLVSKEDLLEAVWKKKGREVIVNEGNLNTQVSILRKSLGDDESHPTYIETVRAMGFRFIAPVTKIAGQVPAGIHEPAYAPDQSFEIESHCFVPTYIGNLVEGGVEHSTQWGTFRQFLFEDANAHLHVSAYGIGVWDIHDTKQFTCLTDLGLWRRACFQTVLAGEHEVCRDTKKLLTKARSSGAEVLPGVGGAIKYALSVFLLRRHTWPPEQLRSALKLISCPRVLLQDGSKSFDRNESIVRERTMLQLGFEHPDLREFGVFGADFGYAGWAGVSYYGSGNEAGRLASTIVDFEVALQALWLFCHVVKGIADQANKNQVPALRTAASIIRCELGRLKTIGPTESTEERMMCEAILVTSRIETHSSATLDSIARILR